MGRKTNTMGATPAVLAATTAVTLTTMFAGAMGLWPGGTGHEPTASVLAPQTEAVDLSVTVAAQSAPARDVITDILGPELRWGATIPVPFGCQVAAPIISAQSGPVTVHVFGAGLGGVVTDQLDRCGTTSEVSGTTASTITLPDGRLTAWTRGDILATVASAGVPGQDARDLDVALVSALSAASCPDLNPTLADATRNPTQAGYAQHTQLATVTIPSAPEAPALGSQTTPLTGPTPLRPALPTGLAGPPLPAEVTRPVAPTWPGAELLTAQVQVPLLDVVGPGCGWDFTGSVPPAADQAVLTALTDETVAAKKAELTAAQTQWVTDATTYLAASALYEPLVVPWEAYTAAMGKVADSWAEQLLALTTYNQAVATYDAAVTAQQTFLAEQALAQAAFDAAVTACKAAAAEPQPSPTPSPTPTVTPEPAPTCPAPRPVILDQATPTIPVLPVPPTLWTATAP